ncbi:MAG: hypothetical protein N2439_14205, partial [Anaerolineae bacterium]|nr:hypothetical protein [Anaerolineae bacterium]
MAQLLVAGHGRVSDLLGTYLRDALPNDYCVVADPVVCRCEIAAVVVGPAGVVVIDVEEAPSAGTDAPATEAHSLAAVRRFLAEEFGALRLAVFYFRVAAPPVRVTTWTATELATWRVRAPAAAAGQELAPAILDIAPAAESALLDPVFREQLAIAFRDRQISPWQRTTRPFVFRSGSGLLGAAKQVWTIYDALQHMDRHPEDGIYHLRNRSLEQWLIGEGALHLAALARHAADRCLDDPRRALEEFLVATGLVTRPQPIVRPRRLDLGYILAGEAATGRLTLQKGRGPGYLIGHLDTSDPCLHVAPSVFSGEQVEVAVTVDTADLLILPRPYEALVAVHTAASDQPITVPVRFQVMPAPSRLQRYLGRPLIGAAAGAAMGGTLGLICGVSAGPDALGPLSRWMPGAPLFWIALFTLLWAAMGVLRGLLQPPAWPVAYALLRWFYSVFIWACALGLFGATAVWLWYQGYLEPGGVRGNVLWIALHYGAALSCLPATLEELELSLPFTERVIRPLLQAVSRLISRMTPAQTLQRTRRNLELAGPS